MDLDLEGKVAIVTGGSAGIGRGIVERLVEEGAHAVIVDINIEEAEKAAAVIGRQTLAVKMDVTKKAEVDAAVQTVLDKYGQIDILVNNAALSWPQRFVDMEEEDWDRMCDVNLKGVYLITRPVLCPYGEATIRKNHQYFFDRRKRGDCEIFPLFCHQICRHRTHPSLGSRVCRIRSQHQCRVSGCRANPPVGSPVAGYGKRTGQTH